MPNTPTITAPRAASAIRRVPEPVRAAGFALGLLLIEIVFAHGAVGIGASKYAFLLVGGLALAALLRFPLASALVFFGLTDFIFYPLKFAHQVGPANLRPYELILVVLLVIAVAQPKRKTWGGVAGGALATFFVLLTVSSAIAVGSHATTFKEALDWGRPMFLLSFFWVIVRLFPEARDRERLLAGATVIAAATGLLALVITAGSGIGQSLQEAAGNTVREQGSLSRIRLPGLSAAYGLFWYSAIKAMGTSGRTRAWWVAGFAGIAFNIVFSFNRNMWVGILLGFAVLCMVGGPLLRQRLAIGVLVVATLVTGFLLFGGSAGKEAVRPVVERGETLVNPGKTAHESSLEQRDVETKVAWRTARKNLLFGIGPGVPFGFAIPEAIRNNEGQVIGFSQTPQLFLHDQYLYLLMITGIPGLLAFVIFLGAPVVTAFRFVKDDLSIIACALGIAMIMLSSFVAIYFTVVDMTAVLGLLAGVVNAGVEERRKAEA